MSQQHLLPLSHKAVGALARYIVSSQDWLVEQTFQYAKRHGYTKYTSALSKDWQISISGLSTALVSALETVEVYPEIKLEENLLEDPFTIFGVTSARRHRSRGVTLGMFLGLMKYYRQSYIDLIESADFNPNQSAGYRYFINRFFDRVELGFLYDGTPSLEDQKTRDLQENNRFLTNEKNRLLMLFESLDVPVGLFDSNGEVNRLNKAWENLFGEMANLYDPFPADLPTGGIANVLSSLIQQGEIGSDSERGLITNQGYRYFQIKARQTTDVCGKFSGIIVLLNDITDRIAAEAELKKHTDYIESLVEERSAALLKTNELLRKEIRERKEAEKVQCELYQQLLHSQKMEAIGTLAGGIAHDFNNVLAAILGYAELVKEQIPYSLSVNDYLAEIMTACHRARQLVKQILSFCGKENGAQLPTKFAAIVLETLQLLRATIPATIQIKQQIDSDCGSVMIPSTHIHQILMNLCANAYHAMKEKGGILSVSLCSLKEPSTEWERELLVKPGPYIRLSVSDSGHGMDEGTRKRIFEPYFTTKKHGEGTGLGLSVIQSIVQNHGGYIMVFSELEKGTAFHIYFPETEAAIGAAEKNVLEEVPGGTEHILIVDDETALVVMWQQQLESLGYRVTGCTDSEMALTLFRRSPEAFDLVLTDMNMPKLTGSRLSKVLMDIRPDIPIILSTGYDENMTAERAETLGIKAFLLKPVMQKELAKTIRRVLEEKIK